jgi:hypothetical protein
MESRKTQKAALDRKIGLLTKEVRKRNRKVRKSAIKLLTH